VTAAAAAAVAAAARAAALRQVGRCRLTVSHPMLKAPGSILLKLRCDGPLSDVAFNFNLHRYTQVVSTLSPRERCAALRSIAPAAAAAALVRLMTPPQLAAALAGCSSITSTRPTLNRRSESARL